VGIVYCVSRGGSRLVDRRSYYEVKRLSKASVKNILDFIRNSELYRANFTTGAHNKLKKLRTALFRATYCGNILQRFRDKLLVPSSRVKIFKGQEELLTLGD
jgi:hypothetical protein